jgi:hypothetical protein
MEDKHSRWLLQFVKEHFALTSALAIVTGVTLATVFLYGYLSVFDSRLFWLVQYQDILTFSLIAVATIGAVSSLIPPTFATISASGLVKGVPEWGFIVFVGIILVVGIAQTLFGEYRSPEPQYSHIVFGFITIFLCACVVFTFTRFIHLGTWPNTIQMGWVLAVTMTAAYSFGTWLGFSVLQSKANNQDILLKSETINKAKIVMATSHHTILYKDNVVYVVPTADIVKIVSPRHFGDQ